MLSKYNRANFREENNHRERVLPCTSLMLSETSRFGDLQIFVKRMLRDCTRERISLQMNDKIHSWGSVGRYGMRHLSGEEVLSRAVKLFPEVYDHENEKYEIGHLIGRRSWSEDEDAIVHGPGVGKGLLIILFDPEYTIDYMMTNCPGPSFS